MRQNVIDLQRFYDSPLGGVARAMIGRRLATLWPQDGDFSGIDMLGYGFGVPYLMDYCPALRSLVLAMPEDQGAQVESSRRGVISVLVGDEALPFPPASFDRVFIAHGLEEARHPARLLAELWRILRPEGQLVIIAPNRAGLWARSETSPFGAGRPFSRSQLKATLIAAQFQPTAWSGALYGPPLSALSKTAPGFERFGETVWPRFSGIILVQAIKRLYAHSDRGEAHAARIPRFVGAAPIRARLHEET